MTKEKQKAAFEFMFAKMGESIYWQPGALTRSGNPQGNPPDLNLAEAQSIFTILVKKDLIIPTGSLHGQVCYLLHQAKEDEWRELIANTREIGWLEKYRWTILKYIGVFLLWISSIMISTFLQETTKKKVEELQRAISTNSPAGNFGNSQTNQSNNKKTN